MNREYEIKHYKKIVVEDKSTLQCVSAKYHIGFIRRCLECGFLTTHVVSDETLDTIMETSYIRDKLNSNILSKTLFTKDEALNADIFDKILKQILHYMSLGEFGVKNIDLSNGKSITIDLFEVCTLPELKTIIEEDVYSNKPLSTLKVSDILRLCEQYNIKLDVSKIRNNELKSHLIIQSTKSRLTGITGDDIVRAMVLIATGSSLLIKSPEVIKECQGWDCFEKLDKKSLCSLLETYQFELSQVFNRHKKILLSFKNEETKRTLNKISKMSKKNHVPIKMSLNKVFINKHLTFDGSTNELLSGMVKDLSKVSIVDKMKYIHYLQHKLSIRDLKIENDVFFIRNGKAHVKPITRNYSNERVAIVLELVFGSLVEDLKPILNGKTVKYPENVDYGLPISEKQSLSHLPYGTTIRSKSGDNISAGIYWKNEWGAKDLDLSSISLSGFRTGWGQVSGYDNKQAIFSGDITSAPNGACEFLTVVDDNNPVVLVNNVFNGENTSKYKIIVGEDGANRDNFVDKAHFELETSFKNSEQATLGILEKKKFTLFPLNTRGGSVSNPKCASVISTMMVDYLKTKNLLNVCGAKITTNESDECDIDLSLEGITFKKLYDVFNKKLDI